MHFLYNYYIPILLLSTKTVSDKQRIIYGVYTDELFVNFSLLRLSIYCVHVIVLYNTH